MISAINSAVSGFNAAVTQINVSANNIANASTTQTSENGILVNTPYTPKQVIQSSAPDGGVTTNIENTTPASIEINDQNNPAAGANGITAYPNEDEAQQLVNTNIATYNAQANLSVIKVQNNVFQSLLNIVT